MNIRHFIIKTICSCALLGGAAACVNVDYTLGNNILPGSERFETKVIDIPLDSIEMQTISNLSAYSTLRMAFGSIMDDSDDVTRISRRSCAFPLIPVCDSIYDWGENPVFKSFTLLIVKDSACLHDNSQKDIMQNLKLYSIHDLDGKGWTDTTFYGNYKYTGDLSNSMFEGLETITKGTPIYGGESTFNIALNERFAKSYFGKDGKGGKEKVSDVEAYSRNHPGLYICTEDPDNVGGRINFFKVKPIKDQNGGLNNNFAALRYTADYGNRKQVDTVAVFYYGPNQLGSDAEHSSFNAVEEEIVGGGSLCGLAEEAIHVEGGTGIKPVIRASYIRRAILEALNTTFSDMEAAVSRDKIIINRATINMPFNMPEEYNDWGLYPQTLNPTVRIEDSETKSITYGSITDAIVPEANQGGINRDILRYTPDVTHHIQQILSTAPDKAEELSNKDIWFMILAKEVYEVKNNSSTSDYYNQLAYLNYYNQLYGGGYGYGGYGYGGYGYGGYGYDSYGYNNYYNYYAMQAMMNSANSDSKTQTINDLDKERYYRCSLNGPKVKNGEKPYLRIVYSYLKEE